MIVHSTKKVLHVTESYGGGVTSAISTYVACSSHVDHYLFATIRSSDATGEESNPSFKRILIAPRTLSLLWVFYRFLYTVKPDVIHLHSTYAGFFVRIIPLFWKCTLVYTPHAYAFLRNDNPLRLKIYRLVEYILSYRTNILAACSKHEELESKKLNSRTKTIELVNICAELPVYKNTEPKSRPIVSMVGRISAQKGVVYFAEIAKLLKNNIHLRWVGGGEPELVNYLEQLGVEVTGWVTRENALKLLAESDLYIHTAEWDGFPISVLEAAKLEIPTMLRNIGPFDAESLWTIHSSEQMAKEIEKFCSGDKLTKSLAVKNCEDINFYHDSTLLSARLSVLYDV